MNWLWSYTGDMFSGGIKMCSRYQFTTSDTPMLHNNWTQPYY